MPTITRKSFLLASAVAAVPLLIATSAASAQYRVDNNDGRALDSNNRLGSGGYNSGREYRGPAPSGNDIVTGNVTGLRYFHGRVDYTDPKAFRGRSQSFSSSDNLVRAAGAQPSPDNPNVSYAPEGRLFYGESRAVAPPPTALQIAPGVPGYVSSAQVTPRPMGDQRLGDVSSGNMVDRPRADQLILPGPTNQQGEQTSIVGSALLGIRPMTGDEQSYLGGLNNFDRSRGLGLDDAAIARMRAELNGGVLPPTDATQNNQTNQPGAPGAAPTQTPPPGTLLNQPLNDTAPGSSVQNQALNTQVANTPGAQTDQGQRQRLLIPPERQSEQYREMLKKYQQLEAERKLTPQEAARAYNELSRLSQQQPGQPGQPAQPGQPGQVGQQPGTPGALPQGNRPAGVPSGAPPQAQPGQAPGAGAAAPGAAPGATSAKPAAPPKEIKKPVPVKVQSMATGTQAKGLADLQKQAEDLMRQGKYTQALDKYDAAQQVAPNNPLIKMGRAIAELGGSYYARADGHIREAFSESPAVMVAEYDLRSFLGEERLQGLVKDLRALAEKEKRDPRPTFLLAFIAYNTAQPQAAEGYLSLAEKRAGGRDPFYQTVRNTWTIPEQQNQAAPTTQPNK